MSIVQAFAQQSFGDGAYVVDIVPVISHGIVASVTDNSGASLHLLPFDPMALKTSSGNLLKPFVKTANSSNINAITSVNENVVAICGDQGLKLYDLRTSLSGGAAVHQFTIESNAEMLCLASNQDNKIAVGTQLVSADAGVVLWDIRTAKQSVAYIDSHSDDVTDISFHPHDNTALLSGSVDGLVNIYNTAIADEDEAVFQVINHGASIHKARFLPDNRILALSHMETMSIYTLANPDSEEPDVKPLEFGDIRQSWDCDYIADLLLSDGYIGAGSNSEKHEFKLIPFNSNSGQVDLSNVITLGGAHGEEVVRAIHINHQAQCVYTGGEDGIVRVWRPQDSGNSLAAAEPWQNVSDQAGEAMAVDDESEKSGDSATKGGEWEQVETKHKHKHKHKSKDKHSKSKEKDEDEARKLEKKARKEKKRAKEEAKSKKESSKHSKDRKEQARYQPY
ncbi:hypothetical protein AWJ20_4221 [Sugiyamaella lignohabitans]|uniref:Uncharacterized protein n=1 Tax=Sugiyamaella lignohabitans TaxID=796027 RepID=A0A161HFP5_9ASCO|nr:uncharacterized protein AWJ20_4221 [Sugiyamaella lignohabitans]ANB11411.1 hypothetical protein AWJ20_4221 [Sugiyamaella lignohabitans]